LPVPSTAAVQFGLSHELATENGIQFDSLGFPLVANLPERSISSISPQDTVCISTLSLKDLSIDEINHLWFKDIGSRMADQTGKKSSDVESVDSLRQLSVLMQL
jgi:hypothetical protein